MSLLTRVSELKRETAKCGDSTYRRHCSALQRVIEGGIVIDVGGGSPWPADWINKELKEILKKNGYCIDIDISFKPHLVSDAAALPIKSESVNGVICNTVLEHVPSPQLVINEIHRVLAAEGACFAKVPWIYPYHPSPRDYWRFSADCLKYLFRDFSYVEVLPEVGGMIHTVGVSFLNELKSQLQLGGKMALCRAPLILRAVDEICKWLVAFKGRGKESWDVSRYMDFFYERNSSCLVTLAIK